VEWVRDGQPADVQLSYYPGRTWEGKVEYVYPDLNPKTRTLKVRLRFDNPDETLKPNMFADVSIYGGPQRDVVIIPEEALIRDGEENRVILAMGEGRFQPRSVVPGISSGGWVEIQRGLKAGEEVVTSAQFLIDSEASLKASIQRMSSSSQQASQKPEPKPITGTGTLHAVMPEEHKINMTHSPIPAIDWPQMTMPFRVKPEVKLDEFSPEDEVEFELEKGEDGYVIKSMHKR
jgi:Cu(I)/Ag(I) efflux system membrane fusion protein